MIDLNNIPEDENTNDFQIIPTDTVVRASINIKPGEISILEFGEGVFFKKSQTSSAKWLELELTIISENFYGRKVWDKIFVDGDTLGKSGMPKAKEIGLKTLRRILDSAFNLKSSDNSDAAKSKRQISGIGDLISKEICFKVGVAESNGYSPKNKIKWILTPDDKEYVVGSSYSDYEKPSQIQQNQQSTIPSEATPAFMK
tara:strand:+ start:304 stop:903 length:600 start_codon:yes stop_codon:yes gene_type:complete